MLITVAVNRLHTHYRNYKWLPNTRFDDITLLCMQHEQKTTLRPIRRGKHLKLNDVSRNFTLLSGWSFITGHSLIIQLFFGYLKTYIANVIQKLIIRLLFGFETCPTFWKLTIS